MDLSEILGRDREAILDEARHSLRDAGSIHYRTLGGAEVLDRLGTLLDAIGLTIEARDLGPTLRLVDELAGLRSAMGYPLSELQTAFNALEASTWRHVSAALPPDHVAAALGLIGSSFGAAKDELARAYVQAAAASHVPAVDIAALMDGSAAG